MTETASAPATTATPATSLPIAHLLRAVCHLIAVASVSTWAFLAWPLPWPGVLIGAGAIVLTVLIWALFLSPRPVLRADRFGRSLVELLLTAGAAAALLDLGINWLVVAAYFVVAAALGFLAGRHARA